MKILRGSLTETRYDFPGDSEPKEMKMKSQSVHEENSVAYMADELGLHRVTNEGSDFAVSLHCRFSHCMISPRYLLIFLSIYAAKCGQGRMLDLQREDRQKKPCSQMRILLSIRSSIAGYVNERGEHDDL